METFGGVPEGSTSGSGECRVLFHILLGGSCARCSIIIIHALLIITCVQCIIKPCLHGDSDPDPDPDWLCLHGSKLDSNRDSDHLSHVDCDPDSNPDLGPGAL